MDMLNQFILIFPEIVLTSVAMCMQLLAVFFKNHLRLISLLTIAVLLVLGTYIINFVTLVTGNYLRVFVDFIKIAAILSIFIGTLGAIMQSSLKRLMAYSTILNVGYVLIAISLHADKGFRSAIIYMVMYVIGTVDFFAWLVTLFGKKAI